MTIVADPVVPSNDAAQQQNDVPGQQDAEVAQPQSDAAQTPQEAQPEAGEKLTDEQKRIRALERRIARQAAARGAAEREAEMLRAQVEQQQRPAQEQDNSEQPRLTPERIEQLAAERARVIAYQADVERRADAMLKAGAKLDGFEAALAAVREEVPLVWATRAGEMPTPFLEAVLEAEKPAELLRWLGQNPDEAAAFADLSPAQIGRRIAKLEERLEREAKAKTSAAPTPLKPVTSRQSPDNLPSDSDSIGDWMRKERARLKAARAV